MKVLSAFSGSLDIASAYTPTTPGAFELVKRDDFLHDPLFTSYDIERN